MCNTFHVSSHMEILVVFEYGRNWDLSHAHLLGTFVHNHINRNIY
jgi:hypothetical protein